jgi:hypothetical protein
MTDPRILPCSESACHGCIRRLSNAEIEFDCSFCKSKHRPYGDEVNFFPNLALSKLIRTKAGLVYRNETVDKLRLKLDEIEHKYDEFKANPDIEADKVNEHCSRLRNQVHLQTDILIEKIHQFNEDMIAQIDDYEKLCKKSLEENQQKCQKAKSEFMEEVKKFSEEITNYLKEFKIDDTKVKDGLLLAERQLKKLEEEDLKLQKVKFCGISVEFKKNESKPDKSLLGSFGVKQLSFDFKNMKEVMLNCPNYSSSVQLFKLENETNVAFYINFTNNYANMVNFDNAGQLVDQVPNLFTKCQTRNLKVIKQHDKYVIYVNVYNYHKSCIYDEVNITCMNAIGLKCPGILLIANGSLKYITHLPTALTFQHIAANSSKLLCVDELHRFTCYRLDLRVVVSVGIQKVQDHVLATLVSIEMNEDYLFALCSTQKLKIFNLARYDLVKEISINADQIKLVSTEFLALYDSTSRMLCLYNQGAEFEFALLEKINLVGSIETGLKLARDKTRFISFYNEKKMKFLDINVNARTDQSINF